MRSSRAMPRQCTHKRTCIVTTSICRRGPRSQSRRARWRETSGLKVLLRTHSARDRQRQTSREACLSIQFGQQARLSCIWHYNRLIYLTVGSGTRLAARRTPPLTCEEAVQPGDLALTCVRGARLFVQSIFVFSTRLATASQPALSKAHGN